MFITVTNCSLQQRVKRVRLNNMHRDAGRWKHGEGIHTPVLSKEEQGGRWCLFHHRFRSRHIFRVAKDFFPNFPKLPRKLFCATFSYKLSPQRSLRLFLVWPPKKVFMCFYANLGRRFLKSSNVGHHFYADYQGCCQNFQQIKTFGCALASPATNLQHHCFS